MLSERAINRVLIRLARAIAIAIVALPVKLPFGSNADLWFALNYAWADGGNSGSCN